MSVSRSSISIISELKACTHANSQASVADRIRLLGGTQRLNSSTGKVILIVYLMEKLPLFPNHTFFCKKKQ